MLCETEAMLQIQEFCGLQLKSFMQKETNISFVLRKIVFTF